MLTQYVKGKGETQLIWIRDSYRDFLISLQGFSINNDTHHNEDKYLATNCHFFAWEKAIQIKDTLVSLSPSLLYFYFIFLIYR